MYAQMQQKSGDAVHALENFRNAREIYEQEPLKSESTEQLAELYEGMGDSFIASGRSLKNISEAKAMYQRSLEELQDLREKGKLNSENINKPAEIEQKVAKCDANLGNKR